MKRLTGLDAAFLYAETPTMPAHVAITCVLDPSGAPGGWSFERVAVLVEARLDLMAPLRRRLVEVPFGLHHPVWVEDPDFDLDRHLHRARLEAPGGTAQLAGFVGAVTSRPLERSRPLWELHVVEGLGTGMVAIVAKVHHAAIDGISGLELAAVLLDPDPARPRGPQRRSQWRPEPIPSDAELVADALASLAGQPAALARAVSRGIGVGRRMAEGERKEGEGAPPWPFGGPRTSFNAAITAQRRCALAQVAMDDLRAVQRHSGGTLNDVVLAVCAGALRRLLAERGESPERSLVALVPLSVRTEDERGTMGNRVSAMLVSLATTIEDPLDRLRAISRGSRQARRVAVAMGPETLADWAQLLAPPLVSGVSGLVSRLRVFDRLAPVCNVSISKLAGPRSPQYLAGARMVAPYAMGPVADGVGLNITALSYLGSMFFGLSACAQALPELDRLADHLGDALNELGKAGGAGQG